MTSQVEYEVTRAASAMQKLLTQRGYAADRSPSSLAEVDRFLDREAPGGVAKAGTTLDVAREYAAQALGGYIGMVLVEHALGEWHPDALAPTDPDSIVVLMPDGSEHHVVRLVLARMTPGSVGRSFAGLGAQHGLGVRVPAQRGRRVLARLLG